MKYILMLLAIGTIAFVVQPGRASSMSPQDSARTARQSVTPEPAKTVEKKADDCGCESQTPPVLAIVNGVKIMIQDVDEPIKNRVTPLQNQVIEARKRQLDLEINSRLLDAEARRLGITPEKLLAREVATRIKTPTDAEAKAFYDLNKTQIQGEYKDVKGQVINYLKGQWQQDVAKKYAEHLRVGARVRVLVKTATPPATEADRARVFAIVNGKNITSGDVEDSLKVLIASVQEQVYELRKAALEAKVNDALVEQEARKKNTTADYLYRTEVVPRIKLISEEAVRKFYDENKSRMDGGFDQMRPQIIQYLDNRERGVAEQAFANDLRKAYAVEMFLKPPDPPRFDIAIDDRPWRGGPNAPVTIVEFTDYECPSCGAT